MDQPNKEYAFGDSYHVWSYHDYYILLRPSGKFFEVSTKKELTSSFSLTRWLADNAAGVNYLLQRAAATIDCHAFGYVWAVHPDGPFQNHSEFVENLIKHAPLRRDYTIRIEPIELSINSLYAAKQLDLNLVA